MKEKISKLEKIYEKLKRDMSYMSVRDLIKLNDEGNIKYDPGYQRNFIWNTTKSTNLVETILINGEIPPITVMKNQDKVEIIDGRQRYETLLRFYNNKFKLKEIGLQKEALKDLRDMYYDDLPENLRKIFLEYKFKVITYTANLSISESDIDLVKRDLFRRYNYGMTALKKAEIARAKYLYEALTESLEMLLKTDEKLYNQCIEVLLPANKREKLEDREKINLLLVNIREMITTVYIPIIEEKSVKFGATVIDRYYETFIIKGLSGKEKEEKRNEFVKIFEKIYLVKKKLEKDNNYLQNNTIFFKTLYWMFAILYKEYSDDFYKFNINQLCHYVENGGKGYFDNYENWTSNSIENRYHYMKNYINKILKLNIDGYLEEVRNNKKKVACKRKEKLPRDGSWNKIGAEKQVATYLDSMKISEIIERIKENRFIIRSNYQRGEVTSRKKASRIIESIILGVKLPPIYIHVKSGEDGIEKFTVLDGQQRLISILKFMGEQVTDEKYEWITTYKDKYALCGLKDLDGLNGKVYEGEDSLTPSKRKLIDDYVVEFIRINQKGNEEFNPIDMFLRLNQNPCPIGINSFEMWNSFDIVKCIDRIKEIAQCPLFKQFTAKMEEAELVTVLAYMNYKEIDIEHINKFFSVYNCIKNRDKRNEHYEIKLKVLNKEGITNYLEKIEPDTKEEKELLESINSVNDFVDKLKILSNNKDEVLLKTFNPYMKNPTKVSKNDFYIIWLILQEIDSHIIKTYRKEILEDLEEVFKLMKNMPEDKNEKSFINFMKDVAEKYAKYSGKIS